MNKSSSYRDIKRDASVFSREEYPGDSVDASHSSASPSAPFYGGGAGLQSTETRRMSASIGSRVGILHTALLDFARPLGDRVRSGLPESSVIAQPGKSLWVIGDTSGVPKEEMAGIVLESWMEDAAPRPPEGDMIAAHDTVAIYSRKSPTKIGKLVNRGCHAAHMASSLDQPPETARPPDPSDPLDGTEAKAIDQARCRSPQGAKYTACLRVRPADLL